jgi:hypothetical protein
VIALAVALLPSACSGDGDAETTTGAIPGGAGDLADHLWAAGTGGERQRPPHHLAPVGERAGELEPGDEHTCDHNRTHVRKRRRMCQGRFIHTPLEPLVKISL